MAAAYSGAAPYGNFAKYYNFNPAEKRIKLLPTNILELFPRSKEIVVLDIGCNAGDLTVGFYNHLMQGQNHSEINVHILALDIDPNLILQAKETNPYPNNIEYAVLDIMDELAAKEVLNQNLKKFKKVKFDLMLCFSVTMWIHLNHGDGGMRRFLKSASNITYYLLLEPQHWKCYMSASRRMRRLNCDKFQDLKKIPVTRMVADNIEEYLEKDCELKKVCVFGLTDWKRNIILFKQTETPEVEVQWKWL